MPHLLRTLFILLLIGVLLTAGCTSLVEDNGAGTNVTTEENQVPASYQATISQPDATSDLIRMDTDIYNAGEVVEFSVVNTGVLPLTCTNTPPDFGVTFQTGSGRWATRMGPDVPVEGNISYLQKGESTKTYQFVTDGWTPGRYRIVSDCGVEHEFLVRALPKITPTQAVCPPVNATNTTPWVKIDAVADQSLGRPFTIRGTTNLPAGTELKYSIFILASQEDATTLPTGAAFTTPVDEGSCGINTWSAMGEIQVAGEFFIAIADPDRKATAIKRFNVV